MCLDGIGSQLGMMGERKGSWKPNGQGKQEDGYRNRWEYEVAKREKIPRITDCCRVHVKKRWMKLTTVNSLPGSRFCTCSSWGWYVLPEAGANMRSMMTTRTRCLTAHQ